MSQPLVTTRRVEFADTDMAGIMHFTAYYRMMEQAEHELLRSVGLTVHNRNEPDTLSWPRVASHCEFSGSVRFEDVVEIAVSIQRIGTKSVTYEFAFSHNGTQIATGSMTSVCCRMIEGEPLKSVAIPANIVQRLDRFKNHLATPEE